MGGWCDGWCACEGWVDGLMVWCGGWGGGVVGNGWMGGWVWWVFGVGQVGGVGAVFVVGWWGEY